ncbi:MAG: asparagine synthase (glutamine-hydrolyzing) [Solirubrobacterales bacterium]|nr:asparagine synthase (glutamine-hydrolyzing) [Solirubrobacterales bacterium]
MCGVSGLITNVPVDLRGHIDAMTDSLAHRGPDDRGVAVFDEAGVALGMRRLSIVDLDGGHQPMWTRDRRFCLVFNGEIYNAPALRSELVALGQRFDTDHSDTEVVLHGFARWGHDLWLRLNGMFAVLIWDSERRVLVAARDRLGKKPLYIARCRGGYALGSELKATLAGPGVAREVDPIALEQYLTFDYVMGPRSMLAGTTKLPGGHFAEVTPDSLRTTHYWRPSAIDVQPAAGAGARLDGLLDHAVERRLMSDVPLGLFLSGGLDSSTVGYYMRRHSDEVHSFSIGFEEEDFDESHYSTVAATALGTKHHLEIFSENRLQDLLPRVAEVLDEPMGDQSILPTYLLSTFTQQHVKVALGGDGSDELLMGYKAYLPLKVAWMMDRVPGLSEFVARIARRCPDTILGRRARGLHFARELRRSPWERLFMVLGHFRGDARGVLAEGVRAHLPTSVLDEPRTQLHACEDARAAEQTVLAYLRGYLQEDILVKVDRASMATSLEVRSPFLDPDLVQFALGLPVDLRLHRRTGKYLLRQIMRDRLPDELIDRRKVGFGVPLNAWLRSSQRDLVLDYLSPDRLRAQGIFDHIAVSGLVNTHLAGEADLGHQLWLLLLFQLWHERWLGTGPPALPPERGREPSPVPEPLS